MTQTPLPNAILVPRAQIRANPKNARQLFDEAELKELGQTIKAHGLLHPLVVKYAPSRYDGSPYILIDGERRLRASEGILDVLPVIVREVEAGKERQLSLVANLQRTGLTALEEAHGLRDLMKSENLSPQQSAKALGKSLGWSNNRLALLKTKPDVQAVAARKPDAMSSLLLIDTVADKTLRSDLLQQVEDRAPHTQIKARVERYNAEKQRRKQSNQAPDAQTQSRSAENARTGGGNVSRGLPLKGTTAKEVQTTCAQTLKEIGWKIDTLEKWGHDLTDAQKRKLQPEILRLSDRLRGMV